MPVLDIFRRLIPGSQLRDVTVGPTTADGLQLTQSPTDFGVSVSSDRALRMTAFYAGIRLLSENVASLPKFVLEDTDRGPRPAYEHPAYHVINVSPNEYTNVFDFWSVIETWQQGWGNAYALIERDGAGDPVALHQVHPTWVQITMVRGHKWYKVIFPDSARAHLSGTYSDPDMLHFMLVTLDGIKGVNPVLYNAAALGKGLATENFAAEFFRKGGNIKAVLESDGNLGEEAYKKFYKHYLDSSQNFSTPLLEYGIKYKTVPVDPIASTLIQSETFSVQDIARILNIPPHMLAELSHATFSNIEHQTIQFVQYTLRPIVKRQEVELERKLFNQGQSGRYSCKFNLDGLLRGDTKTRAAFYHSAILDGFMSRNEVRAQEGLSRLDGLDEMLYPLNTGIVGADAQKEDNNNEN